MSDSTAFHLLVVCTGNTCRSPLAEVIAREQLRRRGWSGVTVSSAGVGAFAGSGPSGGSLRVAAEHGLELSDHRATLLTADTVERADLILTMSASHLYRVEELGGAGKGAVITTFAGDASGGVPDPIGAPDAEYERTFQVLDALIDASLQRLEPLFSAQDPDAS